MKPYSTKNASAAGLPVSSNYECDTASRPYLIGSVHYIQLNHVGAVFMLTYSPANRNSELAIAAVRIAAIVISDASAEMNRPIPTDVYEIKISTR